MWLLDFWNWFTRGIKIVWNIGLKKPFNITKQSLMGGSVEVKDAKKQMWIMRVLFITGVRTADNWARGYSSYLFSKNLATFCLCSENLNGTELKNNGLICLVEEILWRNSIQATLTRSIVRVRNKWRRREMWSLIKQV